MAYTFMRKGTKECNAEELTTQSPIAIVLTECARLAPPIHLCLSKYFNRTTVNVRIENNGKTAYVTFPDIIQPPIAKCGPLKGVYQFHHCEFRWSDEDDTGSEHSINGQKFACEAQLIHFNTKYGDYDDAIHRKDGLLHISILMEMSEFDNNKLDKLVDIIYKIPCRKAEYDYQTNFFFEWLEDVNFNEYVVYKGSMTTEPFYESVFWLVVNKPITISKAQVKAFRHMHIYDCDKRIKCNSRDLQIPPNDLKPKYTGDNRIKNLTTGETRKPVCSLGIKKVKDTKLSDAEVQAKLESGFKKLLDSDSKSLLKKYLTHELFDKLKTLKTPTFGSTLLDCIQSGLENHDSGVGIYAPDAEAYTVFAELFDPIIEDYHSGFKKTDVHPPKDWGDVESLAGNLDPDGDYVVSTRVRCGRSIQGYPFNPCLTEEQYKEMEKMVSTTLSDLEGELKGKYYPLTGMSKEVQQQLIDDHFLFKEGDRFLQAANACRFWPAGRGIYHNDDKTFLVWCNEEDHLRLISMQMGGDLCAVYRRLVTAVNDIEKRIPFSHDDRLGFLTFCPSNLGTTVRASVHIKVPKLAADMEKLESTAAKYNLQVRGTRGEHTEAEGGVYDISNKRRMGLTEYQAVKEMHDGIAELIAMESCL